ncbi:hypothetical protein BVRB_7g157580 [Beta vulgaris subsp. vulgaris]|uniref:peroxidase P7 n=1 Tax=Beta vulgaris subsp. vulgaris TaxID=3555 RepID=UPI00053F55AA|nr:peroxidase P7 [Beta vulgaris subsp. vulgaris]KMT06588.1 hypothetical protein BVRB_7g157580 [Beta vulgaris subsp. vulgaris]
MASFKSCMASYTSLCMFFLLLSFTTTTHAQRGLSRNFYRARCPNLVNIVRSSIRNAVANDPRMGASLLRLHFHDCFVGGCDASVLLDTPGGEKQSVHNVGSLRGFGVIDTIKQRLENACPGIVSCADILALAARESVVVLGGPSWNVRFGRRDSTSRPSASIADGELPFGFNNLADLIPLFRRKGFSVRELVALSGSHTVGQARCIRFRDRAHGEQNILPSFAQFLQRICPLNSGDNNLGPLDVRSPNAFNNDYFKGLTNFQGLLHSDQVLFTGRGGQTDGIVRLYANNQRIFFRDFSAAMLKMSRMDVLTGRRGTVRSNCRAL